MDKAKPFDIPKREVWEAFKRVKANQGAAGVDGQSIADFEANLSSNLYKLWNRLSSGSYFPPPVRRVEIPKANGGTRPLGIPTVADRIAQEVVRRYLEPILEPVFHADSYGYRPGKSAIDAVRTSPRALLALRLGARPRHQGLLRQHRLGADAQGGPPPYGLPVGAALHRALAEGAGADGGRQRRGAHGGDAAGRGDQAAAGQPVPALRRSTCGWRGSSRSSRSNGTPTMRSVTAEARGGAGATAGALAVRFADCKLVLHPEKTKIVYCKDANRRGDYPNSRSTSSASIPGRKTVWQGQYLRARFLPAQSQGAEGHQPGDPALGSSSPQRQVPGGSGQMYNPYIQRLDQLLQPLLSDAVVRP